MELELKQGKVQESGRHTLKNIRETRVNGLLDGELFKSREEHKKIITTRERHFRISMISFKLFCTTNPCFLFFCDHLNLIKENT